MYNSLILYQRESSSRMWDFCFCLLVLNPVTVSGRMHLVGLVTGSRQHFNLLFNS